MMIYLTATALAVFQTVLVLSGSRQVIKTAGLVTCVAFAAIAGFRGLVGTDTWLYGFLVQFHLEGRDAGLEPGFLFIVDAADVLSSNPHVIIRLTALSFFLLTALFLLRADRTQTVYLVTFFAPQYYLLYSMNGLRIGLATAVFLVSFQSWNKSENKRAILLGAAAFSIHYSILIPAALLVFSSMSTRTTKVRFQRYALVVVGLAAGILLQSPVAEELSAYTEGTATGRSAGLSGVIKLLILIYIARELPIPTQHRRTVSRLCAVVGLCAAATAQFSYAGLRVLDLLIWATPLMYLQAMPEEVPLPRRYIAGLGFVGAVGAAAVLRNIYASSGVGNSPFIPYTTFWADNLQAGLL